MVVVIQSMAVQNCGWHLDYGPSDFGYGRWKLRMVLLNYASRIFSFDKIEATQSHGVGWPMHAGLDIGLRYLLPAMFVS